MNKNREKAYELFEKWFDALMDGGHEFEIVISGKRSQVKSFKIKEAFTKDAVYTVEERIFPIE